MPVRVAVVVAVLAIGLAVEAPRAVGLTIPPAVLLRADQLIE